MKTQGPRLAQLANGIVLEEPKNREDFVRIIFDGGFHCSCHEHNPHAYGKCERQHRKNLLTSPDNHQDGSEPFIHCKHLVRPPHLRLHPSASYEATHLTTLVIKYCNRPKQEMSERQYTAWRQLRQIQSFDDLMVMNAQNIPHPRMMHIIGIFSDLFFFSSLVVTRFEWKNNGDNQASWCPEDEHIEMDPVLSCASDSPESRRNIRLATLLHEAIHSFLDIYVCDDCPTYKHDVTQAGGHARAFMNIAATLKSVMEGLIGNAVEHIASPKEWADNWEDVEYLPSIHDAEKWGWDI